MLYKNKLKNKQTKQTSNRGAYNPQHDIKYICPICGRLFKNYEYDFRKTCCKTSIQKFKP